MRVRNMAIMVVVVLGIVGAAGATPIPGPLGALDPRMVSGLARRASQSLRQEVVDREAAHKVGLDAGDTLTLQLFSSSYADSTGARCLDGSPAGYYMATNSASEDWVIFLEGGGVCYFVEDCLERAKSALGSSKYWDSTMGGGNNVFSGQDYNPFKDFNRVFVPYCGGDTHVGNSTTRNEGMGNLYTSGHVIVRTVVEHLKATTPFAYAERILLSGDSAGGIGTFINADFLSGFMPNSVVKAAPQAGWFVPENIVFYEEFVANITVPVDGILSWWTGVKFAREYLNQDCVEGMALVGKSGAMCWDAPVHYPFIKTPLFVINNRFDAYVIYVLLGAPEDWHTTSTGQAFVREEGERTYASLYQFYGAANNKNSLFAPSCVDHTGDLCMNGGPTLGGYQLNAALWKWFDQGEQLVLFEDCPDGNPCGTVCSC